jgi:hypothetical protein
LAFYKILLHVIRFPVSHEVLLFFTKTYEQINNFSDPCSLQGCIVYSSTCGWIAVFVWCFFSNNILRQYCETSLNQPALEPKKLAGFEGWPVLSDFLCKELLSRDLKNRPIFREGRFSDGPVWSSFTVILHCNTYHCDTVVIYISIHRNTLLPYRDTLTDLLC